MADANENAADSSADESTTQDPIKNVKAEMDRKLQNISDQIRAQNEAMMQQMQAMAQAAQPKASTQKVDLSELAYTDPEAYAEQIAQRVSSRVDQNLKQNSAVQSTLQEMMTEYPELNDTKSEMYAKAMSAYSKLSETEKQSPMGYRLAIREAAADVGLVPVSKRRKTDNDDFAFGGNVNGNGEGDSRRDNRKQKEGEIDQLTLEWSRLLGRDPEDKKVKDGLKKANSRKDYKRYK